MIRSHHFSAILTVKDAISDWSEEDFITVLKDAAAIAKLTPVGELAISFQPQGISAVVLLTESHVALHFWPEEKKVSIDIHVCDYQEDNQDKAKGLANLLTVIMTENGNLEDWKTWTITG